MAVLSLAVHFCPQVVEAVEAWQGRLADPLLRELPGGEVADAPSAAEVLALAEQVPILLSASNEGWGRFADLPHRERLQRLAAAGRIVPLLAHGNGLHAAYATTAELEAELALNRSLLRRALGPEVAVAGAYAEALCYASGLGGVYQDAGVQWVIAADGSREAPFSSGGVAVVPPAFTSFEPAAQSRARHAGVALLHFEVATAADWQALSRAIAGVQNGEPFTIPPADFWHGAPHAEGGRFGYYPRESNLVRADGMYRALSHTVEGPDAYQSVSLYERRPFVLWEGGMPLLDMALFLIENFGLHESEPPNGSESGPILRFLKGARRWGPRLRLEEEQRIAIAMLVLAQEMRRHLNEGRAPRFRRRIAPGTVQALRASLAYRVDNRLNALEFGIQEFGGPAKAAHARPWIVEAREHRLRAAETLTRLEAAVGAVALTPGAWFRVVDMLDAYAHEVLQAAGALGHVTGEAAGVPAAVAFADEYFARIWPPQGAVVLDRFLDANRQFPGGATLPGTGVQAEGRP